MRQIYTEEGYADQERMIILGQTFIFQIGARGTGKTYGAMKYVIERKKRFLYLRRTKTESDLVKSGIANPFKVINRDLAIDVVPERGMYFFPFTLDKEIIGYGAALSTFSNVRGVDFSDVEIILYDEFIPEKTARPIKEEYMALTNMYETVNRNRELNGLEPVKLVCMANSNKLDNPIFLGLEIVNQVAKMMEKKIQIYNDFSKDLTVYMLSDSPISERKKNTALYKLTAGSDFQKMALENMFDLDNDNIRPSKIREYVPAVRIGELCIYKHKHRKEYYVNCTKTGTFNHEYSTSDIDRERFMRKHISILDMYIHDRVFFEDAVSLFLFEKFYEL